MSVQEMKWSQVQGVGSLELDLGRTLGVAVDGKFHVSRLAFKLALLPEHVCEEAWSKFENHFRIVDRGTVFGMRPVGTKEWYEGEPGEVACYLPSWLMHSLAGMYNNLGLLAVYLDELPSDRAQLRMELLYPSGSVMAEPLNYIQSRVVTLLRRHLPQ